MKEEYAAELERIRSRIVAAREAFDHHAMIGEAKDLLESVAKIALTERGRRYTTATKAPEIVKNAQRALELPDRLRDPGDDAAVRLFNGLSETALAVYDLRNELGTGHGRPSTPPIGPDIAELAVHAAEAWTDWALSLLERFRAGDVSSLIAQLRADTFYRGTLSQRFTEVRLHGLDELEQQRLGEAVAQRSRRGTFVVTTDGIDAAADNVTDWPHAYRAGVTEGLLLNDEAHLHPINLARLVTLAGSLRIDDWHLIVDRATGAAWSAELQTNLPEGFAIGDTMAGLTHTLPNPHRPGWSDIATRLRRP